MRLIAVLLLSASVSWADDPKPLEVAGMKATPPKEWKLAEEKPNSMRTATLVLPKVEGDKEDVELAVFFFKGGAGTLEQNLKRQRDKFLPAEGKEAVEEKLTDVKVGTIKAKYQDVSGIYKKKPFPMAEKFTPMKDYRQIYVVFDNADGSYYFNMWGPAKTVEKHKKAFDDLLTSFK
jgi:hypothetical protein